MVVSLPITCAATIATASGITGFTLPGIILLPACNAGKLISPSPASGPLFIHRKSLAIFINATAKVFNCPLISTLVSWQLRPMNLLGIEVKPTCVSFSSSSDTFSPKPSLALTPVPTAVPPCAKECRRGKLDKILSLQSDICLAHASISWLNLTGIASIKWVRPVLTSGHCCALCNKVSCK